MRREYVQREFGVLQNKYQILERGCRLWYKDTMATIIKFCVMLHNMMMEERDEVSRNESEDNYMVVVPLDVTCCFSREDMSFTTPPG